MLPKGAAALGLLGALACASEPQTIQETFAAKNPPRTILIAISPPPRFGATSAVALPGPLGWLATIMSDLARGERLAEQHHLGDPAPALARTLTVSFATYRHLEVKPNRQIDNTRTIRKFFHADLVLDVATAGWGLDGSNRPIYGARLELYDTRTQQVVAAGDCMAPPLKKALAPSWDALVANDAKLLKDELGYASNFCLRQFARNVLGVWLIAGRRLYGETDPPPRDEATSTRERWQ